LGQAKPYLTGDRKTLLRKMPESAALKEPKAAAKYAIEDLGAALFIGLACYSLGRFFSRVVLPDIGGAPIHHLAYMVLFIVGLAVTGIVPLSIVAAAKRLSTFFTSVMSILIMMGMGIGFDVMELAQVFSFAGMTITVLCVIGATIGASAVGYLVGFYPIDAAITGGLCMANRGGNGDIATLGASDRMELMAYAQLSTRLGGALVLLIAGFVFAALLG
jgi:Na+/citrate or Na+/malate symporter